MSGKSTEVWPCEGVMLESTTSDAWKCSRAKPKNRAAEETETRKMLNFLLLLISMRDVRINRKEVTAMISKGLKIYTKTKLKEIPPIISPILSVTYNAPVVNCSLFSRIMSREYGRIRPVRKAYGALNANMKKNTG